MPVLESFEVSSVALCFLVPFSLVHSIAVAIRVVGEGGVIRQWSNQASVLYDDC
ncbi:hypothetical protein D3C77_637700 [compost metagenome]